MRPKIVNHNDDHKKAKGVNKNNIAMISYNKSKDILLNKKHLRQPINRFQSKDNGTEAYKIMPYFNDKIYIQYNEYDAWL